jgi:hypothetical protein
MDAPLRSASVQGHPPWNRGARCLLGRPRHFKARHTMRSELDDVHLTKRMVHNERYTTAFCSGGPQFGFAIDPESVLIDFGRTPPATERGRHIRSPTRAPTVHIGASGGAAPVMRLHRHSAQGEQIDATRRSPTGRLRSQVLVLDILTLKEDFAESTSKLFVSSAQFVDDLAQGRISSSANLRTVCDRPHFLPPSFWHHGEQELSTQCTKQTTHKYTEVRTGPAWVEELSTFLSATMLMS